MALHAAQEDGDEPETMALPPASCIPGPALIPPLLFWQTGILALTTGIVASAHPLPALAVFLLCAWLDQRARGTRLVFLLLCMACGIALGTLSLPGAPAPLPPWLHDPAVPVEARIVSTRGMPDNRLRIVLEDVRPVDGSGGALPLPEKTVWTVEKPDFQPITGQRLVAKLRIRPVRGFLNSGGSDIGRYWRQQGIGYSAYLPGNAEPIRLEGDGNLPARLRAQWHEKMSAALAGIDLPESGKALIPALLFGDQSLIASSDMERVTKAGLRHSLALSGQHLTVVGILAILPVFLLKYLFPRLYLRVPRRLLAGLVSLPLALVCLWLGNAPASLIRAALMLTVLVIAHWRARPHTLMDGLFLAFACILAANPANVFDLGVQLSFTAVAGIALVVPLLRRYPGKDCMSGAYPPVRKLFLLILAALAITLAAQAALLPLTLNAFGRATPGLILNLLWLPTLGLIVLPASWLGMFMLALGFAKAGSLFMQVAALPCVWLMQGLAAMEGAGFLESVWSLRPHWTSMLGFSACYLAALLLLGTSNIRTARRLAITGILLIMTGTGLRLYGGLSQELAFRLLDVGQGQAALIEWPGGRALVDGGGFASSRFDSGRDILAPILTNNRAPRLSFVAASHMDRDHVGGLLFLTEQFTMPLFLMGQTERIQGKPVFEQKSLKNDEVRLAELLAGHDVPQHILAQGDRVYLTRNIWLEALWPPKGHVLKGNDSLVLRLVSHGEGLALLTGDLEPRQQRAMIAGAEPGSLRSRILVVPHHGSRRNLEPALYDVVQPEAALSSSGAGNRWGFPSDEVREALAARNIPLFNTGVSGEVMIYLEKGKLVIHTFRDDLQKP